jgi:hypothetical protein
LSVRVADAITNAPGTIRAATPAVADAIAAALEQWSTDCAKLAKAIRHAELKQWEMTNDTTTLTTPTATSERRTFGRLFQRKSV